MRILITGGSGFIGTNATEAFLALRHTLLNYSSHPPLNSEHAPYWMEGDILDREQLVAVFAAFAPEAVLHLAARAECDETTTVEAGYRVNTEGTRNMLDAIGATPSVQRTIIASTQFVCAPGRIPNDDTDYFPETVYGQSKVITERLTRDANLPSCWTIIRPTNVWGPWHVRYRREFWRILGRGLYLHPGHRPVVRSYGYVKNVVDQIRKILEAPCDLVHGKTLYLGDRPINLFDWVNGFSRAISGRDARVIPRPAMRALALLGDFASAFTGNAFPLNSSRLRSMTTDYNTPMEPTFQLLGENPYTLEDGIRETVEWLESYRGTEASAGGV